MTPKPPKGGLRVPLRSDLDFIIETCLKAPFWGFGGHWKQRI